MRRRPIVRPASIRVRVVACVLAGALLAGGELAGATRSAPARPWAVVYQHVDVALGDVTGLDLLTSEAARVRAVTRRARHARDWDHTPRLSPDGRFVAYGRAYGRQPGLYVVAVRRGTSRRLARAEPSQERDRPASLRPVAWSPDSGRLAFNRECLSTPTCKPGLYVIRRDGRGLRRISPRPGAVAWSPDGRLLACRCGSEIDVLAADGSRRRRVSAAGDGVLGDPSWSPNGRLLAFGRRCVRRGVLGDAVTCALAVVGRDGRHERTIRPRHGQNPPIWTSDGKLLIAAWSTSRIIVADPSRHSARTVLHQVGTSLTAGPNGTFAFIVQRDFRDVLLIYSRDGERLLRRWLPEPAATDDVDIRLG